ncbi:RhoGAP-domain-containing protein [Piromyces finnis]|uniref:RhoGAP-domain-containing protein n=1 Tax=Piromyces finnis TaxID=1754191 RepID=A0A1Y1VER8_9FUNG|nr:RhoGAP-domain-containing protein [Piromyces finnis]|eukprot:ORX54288.1 RhoGAP-domain-containing protein [Piromyces finnis]
MYLLRKYLKNNESINKYIFPETVSTLLKIKSNNNNLYGTKLFGLSIEELLERQRILEEEKNKQKDEKGNNNKKEDENKEGINNYAKNCSKDYNDDINNDFIKNDFVSEEQTELNNIPIYENNTISMESIFQSEYDLKNIPIEIQQFVKYLKQDKVLRKEGIFRLGGCFNLKNEIKEKIDQTGVVDFSNYSDDHAVASLFKQFLRELSGKIIPKELFDVFDEAKDSYDEMGNALLYLPKQRYDTLLYILEFLFHIDTFKAFNKMDIGNLSIMFAPNIIECPEATDMPKTLISPLHITNTIIHYFKRLRIQKEENELKFSYFDVKPEYDSERISVKDITYREYDYEISSLEDSDTMSSSESDGNNSDHNDTYDQDTKNTIKVRDYNNNSEVGISSFLHDEEKNSMNNISRNVDSFLFNDLESIDSSIQIKYCTDVVSLEDTLSNKSYKHSSYNCNLNEVNSHISENEDEDENEKECDNNYNMTSLTNITIKQDLTNENESVNEEKVNNEKKEIIVKQSPSDFFSNLSDNIQKYRNFSFGNEKKSFSKFIENKEYQLLDQNNRFDSNATVINDNKNLEIDCNNISFLIQNKNIINEEAYKSITDTEKLNKSDSYNPNIFENNDKHYYLSLLSNLDDLNKNNTYKKEFIPLQNNKTKIINYENNNTIEINNIKKPIMDSLKYVSGELISNNGINNLYENNHFSNTSKSKYSLLETMKVKDIMELNNEEKTKTGNISIYDSNTLRKNNIIKEEKILEVSNRIIDTEPYTLHSDTNNNNNEEVMSDNYQLNKENIIEEVNKDNNELTNETITEEQKIREIVSSINFYNKNKKKKKLSKCQSAFSDNTRIKKYDHSRLAKSYSQMTMNVQKEDFIKSLRDFNLKMKNYTKMANMKKIRIQQKRIFIERLKDLAHYMKFLDRYCNELKAFSMKENENLEVLKEMETFSRNKYKLIKSYIKDELNKYKVYKDGNISVYYPFVDLQSWMKKNESSDSLSNHKDLKLENLHLYYGINDLSPCQRVLRNLDKKRQLENRPIYVFAMKPDEIRKTYKEIKRELSVLKNTYLDLKKNDTVNKNKIDEYKVVDKLILKELFWYIKRLKKAIIKVKDKKKTDIIKNIANPFERCMYNACKIEKKKIQEELIKYQETFYKLHGRPIKTKNDLKPIEEKYKRYKELKSYLRSFS